MIWSEVLTAGPLLVVHSYALGTAAVVAGFLARQDWLNRAAFGILAFSFAMHSLLLIGLIHDGAFASLPVYMSLLSWCVMLTGLLTWVRKKRALMVILAPTALLVYLAGLLMKPAPVATGLSAMFSVVHVGALFGALALLALSFGAGCLFLLQERAIKAKAKPSQLRRELPALSVLDRINALTVSIGFPLFTVGLLTGFVAARVAYGQLTTGEPKELVSLLVWALFAVLYHQRMARGWQGRKPALMAIVIFLICVFSLTVVNLFLTTHHGFFTPAG